MATIEGFGAAPGLHADFLIIRGNAQAKKGEHETAIATYESALAGTQDAPSPTREAAIYNGLGNVVGHLGQQPSSLDYYRRSLRLTEEHYGAEHPECAARWINIGIALHESGQHNEAVDAYERAQSIYERFLGADHPSVAFALANLANVRLVSGDPDEAVRLFERALQIRENKLRADHPLIGQTLYALVQLRSYHDPAAKEADLRRALAIYAQIYGNDSPQIARPMVVLAEHQREASDLERARETIERAERLIEGAPAHERARQSLFASAVKGKILLDEGQAEAALRLFEHVIEQAEETGAHPSLIAEAQWGLARSLTAVRRDPARALQLAEGALAGARKFGDARAAEEIARWLEARRR